MCKVLQEYNIPISKVQLANFHSLCISLLVAFSQLNFFVKSKTFSIPMQILSNCKSNVSFPFQIIGLGIDGASVMLSDRNGVCGLLHRDNPYAVALHCVCHRLHLVVSQAAEKVKSVKILSKIVSQIYVHINNSSSRLRKFSSIASLLLMANDNDQPDTVDNEGDGIEGISKPGLPGRKYNFL